MNSQQVIDQLKLIVGSSNIKTDANDLAAYGRDWIREFDPNPLVIVLPKTAAEVSKLLAFCHKNHVAVVPSGGRTGLAGGAIAQNKEVVIALDRMNKIEAVDAVGMTISVEAGVTTQKVQEAALEQGLFFPIDLSSKGSCQVGGNISTNAGGLKLIRYGGMREQVLGLEVVLADGQILDMNYNLRKNNTGYDLKHLFISAEGTLGIITRATLRLVRKPRAFELACMGVNEFSQILELLKLCHQKGIDLTAFEFFSDKALQLVLKNHNYLRHPFTNNFQYYVLIEIEKSADFSTSELTPFLESAFAQQLIADAVLSESSQQFRELWGLRENISESISRCGFVHKNDISLPVGGLADFVADLQKIIATSDPDLDIILFGHIGDGNLHLNYIAKKPLERQMFYKKARAVEKIIFKQLEKYRGSVSAEHGIGLVKKDDLKFSRSEQEIAVMCQIKKLLDPHNILNPGKVFDIR